MIARSILIALVLILSGCVSQPMPEGFERSDDFDLEEAAKTRISLGLTYLKNGNYSQAKQNLDKALEFAPRLADAHYSIAYYYQLVGEVTRAQNSFEDALKLAPRNPDIANSYGAFLCQQSRYEEAKSFFTQAVNSQTYANSAETYENMALCSLSQSQPQDAIEYLKTALNHQPTRGKSLLLLTEVLVAEEQYVEAKETLIRYQRVARVSANSLWLAVQIESGLGQVSNAKGYGDMLLSLYPGHAFTQKYREQMSTLVPSAQVVAKQPRVTRQEAVQTQPSQASEQSQQIDQSQPAESSQPAAQSEKVTQQESPEPQVAEPAVAETNPELPVTPEVTDEIIQHTVLAGENLYRISLKYNIKMQKLIEWNQLDPSGSVFQGKKLWVVDPAQLNNAQE